jgi:hypothetical protein
MHSVIELHITVCYSSYDQHSSALLLVVLQALAAQQAEAAQLLLDAAADPMVLCQHRSRPAPSAAAAAAGTSSAVVTESSSSSQQRSEPFSTTALHLLLGECGTLLLGPIAWEVYQQLLAQALKLAVHLQRIEQLGGIRWAFKGRNVEAAAREAAAGASPAAAAVDAKETDEQQQQAAQQRERLVPAYEVLDNCVNDAGERHGTS